MKIRAGAQRAEAEGEKTGQKGGLQESCPLGKLFQKTPVPDGPS